MKTWRRRRWGAAILLIMLTVLILGYWHYIGDQRVCRQTVKALCQITGGEVEIDHATLDILREIKIKSLRVYLPGRCGDPKGQVFSAQEVLLEHEPWSILTRRLRLKTIKAQNARLHIWYDRTRNLTNLQLLNISPDAGQAPQRPTILLRDSTVEYQELEGQNKSPLIHQKISGRIFPSPDNNQVYQFELVSTQEGMVKHSSWEGQYNIQKKELTETRGNFFLERIDISSLPDRIATWQRIYEISQPQGEVITQSHFDPKNGQTVQLSLQNGSLLMPLPDVKIPLRQVSAEILCTPDVIKIKHLSGRYEDYCQFDAQGQIDGYSIKAPFNIQISIAGLTIPQNYWEILRQPSGPTTSDSSDGLNRLVQLIDLLPDSATQLIMRYRPTGNLDIHIQVNRTADMDVPTQYAGTLICRGASLTFEEFPYPLDHIEGSVHFESNNTVIGPLITHKDDQQTTIIGYWNKIQNDQDYQITVESKNTPLDQTLYLAMKPWQQTIWNQFNPKGKVNVVFQITQAPGQPRNDMLNIELVNVATAYKNFAVPLHHVQGKIIWQNERLDFDINPAQTGNGFVKLAGKIICIGQPNQQVACDIHFENIALEQPLIGQLPKHVREDILTAGLSGYFSGDAQCWTPAEINPAHKETNDSNSQDYLLHGLDYRIQALLENGTLKPRIFDYPLNQVVAKGELTNEKLVIESLTGQNEKTKITLTGTIVDSKDFQFHIDAKPLELNETLRKALNKQNIELWNAFRPRGLADLTVDLNRRPDSNNLDYLAIIEPLDTELSFSETAFPLGKASGKITLRPNQTDIETLTIFNPPTTITASGTLTQHEDHNDADIRLLMKSLQCNDTLFAALPKQLRFLNERLNLQGEIDADLQVAHLHQNDSIGHWTVQGRLDVNNGLIQKPLLTENIYGNLQGQAVYNTQDKNFNLSGTITCPSLNVKKRPLNNFTGQLDYQADQNVLTISDISSGLCGGRLAGEIQTFLRDVDTGYKMDLTFHDVDVAQMIEAEKPHENRRKNLRGRVNGRFSMIQPTDQPSRRGNLDFEVKDAVLGTLPVAAQLLHVFNLSLPREGAFNEAKIKGDIIGNKIQFESLILKGSAVKLNGAGIMTTPDNMLDMVFVMDSPYDLPDLPVVTSFIKAIQPQLMQVRVTGSFDEPNVEPIALPTLDDALKQLGGQPDTHAPQPKLLSPPPPKTK